MKNLSKKEGKTYVYRFIRSLSNQKSRNNKVRPTILTDIDK